MSDDCTITIFSTDIADPSTGELQTKWHWKRLTADGAQIDGSGGQRNGLATKKETKALVSEKYPDDKIT